MTNTELISSFIADGEHTIQSLADEIGISRQSLYNKIHNITNFTVPEAVKLSQLLGMSEREMKAALFCESK